ncbi:MAG TPA: aspartate aminotransferase family protein [Actinomycetota bacterium]|jgi:4-aminobutyrate aminotransferase|nr:aspartate aminotransferase family protein [Actinomycetota bacterium]
MSDAGEGGEFLEDDEDELLERHRQVLPSWLALYYKEPIELVRGEGQRVWDSAGREYLDFFGGIVTTISGHVVPKLVEALTEQANRIAHTSTVYLIRPMVELAERLTGLAPVEPPVKAFFVGSGTEAVEAALLFATSWRRSNEIIALRNSYHGRSFGAVGITGNKGWSATSFTPLNVSYALAPYCYRCPLGLSYPDCGVACAEDLRNVIETTTTGEPAAMIAEPIQGVGGFVTPPPEYFQIVKRILDEFGIPFIADEVQTGFGRTGQNFWGIESYNVQADAIVCAKGLGNGMAIGAVVGRQDMVDSLRANSISTFGGNPLAATYALNNLDFIEDNDLQSNAFRVGKFLYEGLKDLEDRYEVVGEVRGKGLMVGVELVKDKESKEPNTDGAARAMEEARERGLLVGRGGLYGNVLRLSPPLVIDEADAQRAIETLDAAFQAVQD